MKQNEFNSIFPEIKIGFKLYSFDGLFFELFKNIKIPCELNIPNTLILDDGKPRLWLFNSRIILNNLKIKIIIFFKKIS